MATVVLHTLDDWDLDAYIRGIPRPKEHPGGLVRGEETLDWIRLMCRKHRVVCIGWDRLHQELLRGEQYDVIVADTLLALGIDPLNWHDGCMSRTISCIGADRRGVYFVNASNASLNDLRCDSGMFMEMVLREGPGGAVGSYRVDDDVNIDGVHFIGVKGALPFRLDNLRGK